MKMFMKRSICVLALTGLCVSLSAIDFKTRIDLGLSGFLIPFNVFAGETGTTGVSPSSGMILPLIDAGFYGQMNVGQNLRFGIGFRALSLIVATVTWPTAYAEVDLWRFSFNARVGGGFFAGLAGFYPFFLLGDYLIPEASLWFKLSNSRIGFGALAPLSASTLNTDIGLNNNVLLYISFMKSIR
jgi:hypothetical protein